ncbi:AraC family transcriptional regulator [Ideonella sp. DXS29W]|uniref:AraC family transcriptional regulator n=1 Tax=Ideonella lacteola TaxID=2984193 RepID=A0ABU9BUL8_9BURK
MNTLFSDIQVRRYAPGSDMPPHTHRRATLSLVLGGSYEEFIRGRRHEGAWGSLLLCPAGEAHSQRFGAEGVRKLQMAPTAEAIERLRGALPVDQAPAVRSLSLADVGRRIAQELQVPDDFSSLVIDGLLHELLGLMAREHARQRGTAPAALQRALALLREQSHRNLALDEIARDVGCDAAELARLFRTHLGESPGEALRRFRLERAAALLSQSRQPLADIAALCGFSDQAHMTRTFKTRLGTTPSAYRRKTSG